MTKELNMFYEYYNNTKNLIENAINMYNESLLQETDNEIVKHGIKEFIRMNSDGKYIRGVLIALGHHIYSGKEDNNYIPLAVAYETFQTAILIHDDIIDKADKRRGKDTIPVVYKNKYNDDYLANGIAICLGDYGFFKAYQHIVENYAKNKNLPLILDVYNDISIKTVMGELIDVELPTINKTKLNKKKVEEQVMEIYRLKTAWYTIIGPFKLGMAITGKSDDKILEILESIGIAFQIKDDLLGIYGDELKLGKPASSDISEFKQTLLYTYINDYKPEYLEELLMYYGKENITNKEIEKVRAIFEESGAKKYATDKMNNLFIESKKKIDKNTKLDDKYKFILKGFITYLETRDK